MVCKTNDKAFIEIQIFQWLFTLTCGMVSCYKEVEHMLRRQLIRLFHTFRNTFDKLCPVWKYLQLLSSPAIFAGDRF